MAKINNDDSSDLDDVEDISDDDFADDFDLKVDAMDSIDARRRLEQLMEDRELDRLINGDLDDWY